MGLQGLGYIGIASPKLDEWRTFMCDVLGVGESSGPPAGDADTLWLKMDDRSWRIAVHSGERDEFAYAGWEVGSPSAFGKMVDHLQGSGVKLDLGTDARLRAALKPVTADAAVIVVAQRVSTIVDADQIIVLEDGEIVGLGRHAELLDSSPTYAEIVASQLSAGAVA